MVALARALGVESNEWCEHTQETYTEFPGRKQGGREAWQWHPPGLMSSRNLPNYIILRHQYLAHLLMQLSTEAKLWKTTWMKTLPCSLLQLPLFSKRLAMHTHVWLLARSANVIKINDLLGKAFTSNETSKNDSEFIGTVRWDLLLTYLTEFSKYLPRLRFN